MAISETTVKEPVCKIERGHTVGLLLIGDSS